MGLVAAERTKTDSTDHEGCEMLESGSKVRCGDQIPRTSQHLVKPARLGLCCPEAQKGAENSKKWENLPFPKPFSPQSGLQSPLD